MVEAKVIISIFSYSFFLSFLTTDCFWQGLKAARRRTQTQPLNRERLKYTLFLNLILICLCYRRRNTKTTTEMSLSLGQPGTGGNIVHLYSDFPVFFTAVTPWRIHHGFCVLRGELQQFIFWQ